MSVQEIIAELPKLSEEERELILRQLSIWTNVLNRRRLWTTPFGRVSAHYAKRRFIPRQKSAPGSPHGLRGNFRGSFGRRVVVLAPYLIFYRFEKSANRVEILRFWHGARDPLSLGL